MAQEQSHSTLNTLLTSTAVVNNQATETDSWLVSYLDVFILIVALLVIMLVKSSPVETVVQQPHPIKVEHPSKEIVSQLNTLIDDHRLDVFSDHQRVNVRLGDTLLFDSSKALLKQEGKEVIQQLIPTLIKLNQHIIIEGHTDDKPINTVLFPSNWELAGARANSVLHYLLSQGVPASHLSAISYGQTRPLVPNNSQTNRGTNRRVNLVIMLNE